MKNRIFWLVITGLMAVSLVMASPEKEKEDVAAKPTGPQYGGRITVSILWESPPRSWDIGKAQGSFWQGYEPPFIGDIEKYGARGDNSWHFPFFLIPPSVAKPFLIESWEVPDDNTIIWHVKQGIHFQNKAPANGREMDAYDFEVCLNRTLEVPRFKTGYWSFIDSIEALDKYTVKINLNFYHPGWMYWLGTAYYTNIYPRELVEQGLTEKWEYVVGTGPWMLEDYVDNVSGTYVRNPDYRVHTTIDGKEYQLPFADELVRVIIPDMAGREAAMRTGKVDLLHEQTQVAKQSILSTSPELQFRPFTNTVNNEGCLWMRVDQGPTADIRVRRALWMAIDYEDYIDKLYGGEADLWYSYLLIPGAEPRAETPWDELPSELVETYSYHPEEAKQLLAEAGYPEGLKLELNIHAEDAYGDVASLLAGYWDRIGVETEIVANEVAVASQIGFDDLHQNMILGGPTGGLPFDMGTRLLGDNIHNKTNWDDPYFTEKFNQMIVEADEDVYVETLKELAVYEAMNYAVHVPAFPKNYTVWWPWIKNYYGESAASYQLDSYVYAFIWVDQELKEEMGF